MVEDARYRTKDYFETYLENSNLTKDDGSTQVNFIIVYGYPDYPITKVFQTKGIDLIFSIGEPESTPKLGFNLEPYGYEEHVPITTFCIDKSGVTGTKLKWKAEAELRRVTENYSIGSHRLLERRADNDQRLGSTILYSAEYMLKYERDTT